jgi:hypothetical protein
MSAPTVVAITPGRSPVRRMGAVIVGDNGGRACTIPTADDGDNVSMGRMDSLRKHNDLLRELQEERAAALRRISRRLELLLDELRASGERLAGAEGVERSAEIASYRELRAEAIKYRWYLEVQREALGLRHHDMLDEFYRIPADVTVDDVEAGLKTRPCREEGVEAGLKTRPYEEKASRT